MPQKMLSPLSALLYLWILCVSIYPSRVGGFNFIIPLEKRRQQELTSSGALISGLRILQPFKTVHISWKHRSSMFDSELWTAQPV